MRCENPKVPEVRNEVYLTESQLASRWQLSVKTLQNARWRGSTLSFLRIGRAVRYRLSDIVEYERTHVRNSTSDDTPPSGG